MMVMWFVGLAIIIGLGVAGYVVMRRDVETTVPTAEDIATSIEIIEK